MGITCRCHVWNAAQGRNESFPPSANSSKFLFVVIVHIYIPASAAHVTCTVATLAQVCVRPTFNPTTKRHNYNVKTRLCAKVSSEYSCLAFWWPGRGYGKNNLRIWFPAFWWPGSGYAQKYIQNVYFWHFRSLAADMRKSNFRMLVSSILVAWPGI